MTLRTRVLGYLTLGVIASCALTVAIAAVLVRHRITTQKLDQVTAQADVLADVGGAPGALHAGDHVYRVGIRHPRRARAATATRVLAAIPSGASRGSIHLGHRSLLYAARPTSDGRVVLIRGAGLPLAEWSPFLVSLALAGLGGFLLAGLLSMLLARRLTRPIGELAHATHELAAGDRRVSVPVRGQDELADLGRSFNVMATRLGRAQEGQRIFLQSVGHELRTPLTSVRGYAEGLREGVLDPVEAGRVIGAEADRLQRLVTDLMDLARFGRDGFAARRLPVDLGAVAEAATLRHGTHGRRLGVTVTAERTPEAWGIGDGERLLQATSNLVENALRLAPAGSNIIVHAGPGTLVVSDEGPGLADGDLSHAFERFYLHRRYRGERDPDAGSGLGLAIVAELVRAMDGQVSATNRHGGGAQFTITLGQVERPPAPDHARDPADLA